MAGRARTVPLVEICNTHVSSQALQLAVSDTNSHEESLVLSPSSSQSLLKTQAGNMPCDPGDANRLESSTHLILSKYGFSLQKKVRSGTNLKTLTDLQITLKQAWEGSPLQLEFGDAVTKAMEQKSLQITSCLCLGLGSLSNRCDTHEYSAKIMNQLIAFETSIGILRQQHTILHVYFQDPVFNAVDRTFLESRGYSILESPASNTVLNEETYLFMAYVPFDVALSTLRECFPKLVLSYSIDWWAQNSFRRYTETYTVLQKFVELRQEIAVPYCVPEDDRLTLYYPSS